MMKNFNNKQKNAGQLHFRQWKQHGYSLFQALKHEVHIATLAVAYLLVASPQEVQAQATDSLMTDREYELDQVEISAQRAPATYSQMARIVSVISRQEIKAAPVASVQELLEYAMGVDVRQRGTYGVQADVSIRGGTFDQSLVLLNGINVSDPQTGHHNLNLPLSLSSIKRIEILNGSSSRVYGPNAFSGAINIITEPSQSNQLTARASYGSFATRDIDVSGDIKTGVLNSFISINNSASDGYRDNTDFNNNSIFYNGVIDGEQTKLSLQAGYSDKGFGANGFYSPEYPDQYEATRTSLVSAQLEGGKKYHTKTATYWRRNHDRFELFRKDPADWYTGHNYHMTDVYGLNLNSWTQWKLGKTSLGAEIRLESILSNQLGEDLNDSISVPGENGQYFTKGHNRSTLSYFLEHSVHLHKFSISAGIMANWISDLHNSWNFYPGVDIAYQIHPKFKLYGTYNQALRMPTFTDLYYSGPNNIGNPKLKPEQAKSYELGAKYNLPFLKMEAAYYYRAGKDIIDWVRTDESFAWQTKNLTQINSMGVEMNALFSFQKSFIHNIQLNYAYSTISKNDTEYISNYALDNLKHKFVLGINHGIVRDLSADWKLRYEDRNGGYSAFDGTDYIGETPYDPFFILDLKLSYQYRNFTLNATATNLLDKTYYDMGNIPQAGRWLMFGVKYELK